MYLSKLELHGFKSFAHKTALHFDPGVTAIVGPNGCGKSNVVDAIRWVLGEQRARLLRSEKMENVIFNGTAGRRALGLAEVSLTVENTRGVLPTEYSEVTLTRRLYRSGESEYLLNGTVCRLKDILDLFMDTGMGAGAYSVIELKMIEDILSDKAADRRRLFEEAAGVTKYKLRRRQALGKLDQTQADLARLTDLVEEIERNVRSLQRQAQKAARHQRLKDRLTTLELALAAWDYEQLAEEHRLLDRETRRLRAEAEGLNARVDQAEAALEAQRTALVGREGGLAERQKALNAHVEAVGQLETERRVAVERREADRRALDRLDREAEADRLRREALARDRDANAAEVQEADAAVAAAEAAEAAATTRRDAAAADADRVRGALAEARREAAEKEKAAAEARAALDRLADRRALRREEQARLEHEYAALAQRAGAAEAAEREAAERQAAAEQDVAEATEARAAARAAHEQRRAALDAAEAAARDARLARDTARAERDLLQALVAEGDGLTAPVAFLRDHEDWPPEGSAATVADLVGAPARDAVAVATALGDWAGCLVVETEAAAQEGIARLRVAEAGRATFIVLQRLPARTHTERSPTPPDTVPALDVARVPDERYRPLLRLLLQNVFIVDTLDEARALREQYPVARFVTRAGEWTSAMGVLSGGGGDGEAPAVRLGRQERIEKATAALGAAEEELTAATAAAAAARAAFQAVDPRDAEVALDAARAALDAARADAARARADREAAEAQRPRLQERLGSLQAAWDNEPDPSDLQAAAEAAAITARDATARRDAAESAHDAANARHRTAEAAYNDARLALVQARHAADALRREGERIARETGDLDRRAAARVEEADRLQAALEEAAQTEQDASGRLDTERASTDALQRAVAEAEGHLLQARALIADTEKILRDLRHERDEALRRRNNTDLRLTEIITRQDAIIERLEEDYGVSLDEAAGRLSDAVGDDGDLDPEAARAELPGLREGLRAIGAVNALALESYEEEKERLDFLSTQRTDLQQAEQTLLDTIDEINTTAAARFDDTFEAVRDAFQRLFADLFGGDATAELTLAGEDPLEAPIEIFARPRGKRLASISLMSSGERSLTAVAFLFAIYLVKPSPFCILDEVDAPLDDANIGRFLDMLKKVAEKTQFVMITHNKKTMEVAD
ncbi:MAG: chromosome segregation protein SMC, partial [Rubricoccaceae bacterium]|nr:chromosome segregation protein SMC [Rubricoccaceae bacterium]